jgi:hypothetical protein
MSVPRWSGLDCLELCDPSAVTTRSVPGSRRYDLPPLWLVPIVLIVMIVLVSTTLGVLGFVAGLFAIYWLQRKADAYIRATDTS